MCLILQSAARSTFNTTRPIVGNARLRCASPARALMYVCVCVCMCVWAIYCETSHNAGHATRSPLQADVATHRACLVVHNCGRSKGTRVSGCLEQRLKGQNRRESQRGEDRGEEGGGQMTAETCPKLRLIAPNSASNHQGASQSHMK
jgi:hypothetical protein